MVKPNWPSFLAMAALSVAAVSFLFRRRNQPSSESDSSTPDSDSDSSTRPLPAGKYQVFMSFRGPDVRKTFADSLYHFLDHSKICTFYDDEELRKGEKIAPSLVKAIRESKIYIPILSKDYASSKWCLEELSLMVKSLNQNQGHILLPIFYFLEPRDVRRQEGSYRRAFQLHSRKYDAETVKEWKEALKVVGEMKGWHVTESDGHGAVIGKVFSQVWSHLMESYTIVTDKLIGIESSVREVSDLLDLDSRGVKIVGIHGMGGIGKTALSKAVYNEVFSRFERLCFIEDIRETLLQKDGAVTLQNKIISSILRQDSDVKDTSEGIHILRDKVCKYKVLVVLDDVDRRFKFDEIFGRLQDFSIESRFIVTTRDKEALKFFEECRLFEAKEMSHIDSFLLFKKHAFRMDDPQEENAVLCEEFVKVAAGLPLALKVIGSLLFHKEKRVWEEKLEELKEIPSSTCVHGILKISYNDLSPSEKNMFLDIACFFIGETKELPFYMWRDCKFYPEIGINNLVLKSLVKIDERNQFQMHDHIRDLGRAIVDEENSRQPWKRSRIWSNEEALDMLLIGQGNDDVEALRIDMRGRADPELTEKEFKGLSGVRFLEVKFARMTGDFSNLLPNVRWLQLDSCSSIPTDVNLKKVVILQLRLSRVTDDWRGWKRVKEEAKKLKVVNLRHCKDLLKVPDLSCSLEVINLEGCIEMGGELCIGNFKNLKLLSFSNTQITKLKGDIRMLQDLKEIYASNLKELPAGIGNLGSLEILRMGRVEVPIPALPTSLKHLTLWSPRVPNLLELKNLEELNFELRYPNIELEIPGDIWLHLTKLKRLKVDGFWGKSLFLQVDSAAENGGSSSSSNGIVRNSAAQLPSSLNSLVLSSCRELETLPNLANLSNLTDLQLDWVGVQDIPDLGQLKMLETFEISYAPNLKSLDGLQNLVLLQQLTLEFCDALEKLPSLSNLTKLHTLKIIHCRALSEFRGMDPMRDYCLTHLEVSNCPRLANVEGLPRSLQALQTLILTGVPSIETLLQHLPCFRNLKELCVAESVPGDGSDIPSVPGIRILHLSGLGNLQELDISSCQQLTEITGFDTLQSLKILRILNCASIQKLSNLSALKNLKVLIISSGTQLSELEKLDGLASLEWLEMYRCTAIKKLPNLCGLTNLTNLHIKECTELTDVNGLERLESLVRLTLVDCASIVRLPDLSELKNLNELNISGCTLLTEIAGLESLGSLQQLDISGCESINKLPHLSRFEYMRYLNISECMQLTELVGVESLESLKVLAMPRCMSIKELPDLSGLTNLKHLDIRECSQLMTGIMGLHKLHSTQVLGVHSSKSVLRWRDRQSHMKYLMFR